MSQLSRRPRGEEIKAQRRKKTPGKGPSRSPSRGRAPAPANAGAPPNTRSAYATIAQEQEAREEAVSGQLQLLRRELPQLLGRLEKIPDPRNPRKCRHKLTVLLLYGVLMFVFQFASRREVNREMTRPQFAANLRLLFPELDTLPHADTLFRLLSTIDVEEIEQAHIALLGRLIRGKKFRRYLINNCYPLAIDGSQKLARDGLWDENLLQRTHGKSEQHHTQYFVYILEASLAFRNGMVIPLLSECLEYAKGDTDSDKQDCEQRAFHRLSERLKNLFPRLPIMLLLDGLYANGPVMQRCQQCNWQFMIVFKDKDLPSVWRKYSVYPSTEESTSKRLAEASIQG